MSDKCKGLCTCVSKELEGAQFFLRNPVGNHKEGLGEPRCANRGEEGRDFIPRGRDNLRPSLLTILSDHLKQQTSVKSQKCEQRWAVPNEMSYKVKGFENDHLLSAQI